MNSNKLPINQYPFLAGGGEMGTLIRDFPWTATPLGDPTNWPAALKIAIGIVLSSPFPMHIAWGNEFIQLYNDGYRNLLLQTDRTEGLGKPVRDSFVEVWEKIAPVLTGVMKGMPVRLKDLQVFLGEEGMQREYYFDFSHSPIIDEQGNVLGVLTNVLETTDTVLTYLQLENLQQEFEAINAKNLEQKQRLIQFLMQSPAGVCILGGDQYVFEIVNPIYQQLFPGRELLGKPVTEALPELINDPILDILHGVLKLGKTFRSAAHLIPMARTADGKIEDRYFDLTYQARFDDHGTPNGILVYALEVTDRKKRELQVQGFMELVGDEIRTPLSSLTTEIEYAGLRLRNATSDDEFLTGVLDRADTHVKLLGQLINTYLNVSSIKRTGKISLNFTSFDLSAVIAELIAKIQPSAPQHLIKFERSAINTVRADKSKIITVLNNLLSSAIKYVPAGGDIAITCKVVGDFVEIEVKDPGIGIRSHDVEKIFHFLNEEIIEAHGGKIWTEKVPRQGFSFYFSLPL